uniref:Uncharacterized protein n=1 Tax=Oryza glumipatula TaxID=40148 RepID=A0A0D9YP72_9ORYZ
MRGAHHLQAILILSILLLPTFLFGSVSANSVIDSKPDGAVIISLEKRGGRRLVLGRSASRSLSANYDPRHDPPVTP